MEENTPDTPDIIETNRLPLEQGHIYLFTVKAPAAPPSSLQPGYYAMEVVHWLDQGPHARAEVKLRQLRQPGGRLAIRHYRAVVIDESNEGLVDGAAPPLVDIRRKHKDEWVVVALGTASMIAGTLVYKKRPK